MRDSKEALRYKAANSLLRTTRAAAKRKYLIIDQQNVFIGDNLKKGLGLRGCDNGIANTTRNTYMTKGFLWGR